MNRRPTPQRPGANPRYAREITELRRSNAAGKHLDRRTKRQRTRGAQKRAAIREES